LFKKTAFFVCLFYSVFVVGFQQKNKNIDSLYSKVQILFSKKAYQQLHLKISELQFADIKKEKDSLTAAKIWHIKANAYYEKEHYFETVPVYNKAISFTPNTEEGKNLKGSILYDRAFAEYYLEQYIRSYKTVKKAETLLSTLKKPDYNYLLSIYADLGSEASYLGFYSEAEYYLKKGFSLFKANKHQLKNKDNNNASKEVLFQYKFIYLYSQSGNEQKMLQHLRQLKKLKSTIKFNETENLMYASSFNDVGDFYLNNREKLIQKEALKKGFIYISKAISLLDKNKHKSNYIQFQFNLAKQLRYSKKFSEALKKNQKIIELAGEDDLRIPFFTAQRGLIFLEKGNLKEAEKMFYNMASLIHKGSESLKQDYSNFKPSTIINHTGLLVEIADELLKNNSKDSVVIHQAAHFYKIGLKQLKNAYLEKSFSKRIKEYYNKSIYGILKTKKLGYGNSTEQFIIENIENIENRLAWKEFNQNRILTKASLPESVLNKESFLRSKIVNARKNNDSLEVLELQNQLEKHQLFLAEEYPTISNYVYKKFNIVDFQKKLNSKTIVFKFKQVNKSLFVFKISKEAIDFKEVGYSSVESQLKNYISILKNKKEDKKLAQYIFETLLPFKNLEETLVIVPDAVLHHLPFETLVDKKGDYLVNNHRINYASHLVFINSNKRSEVIDEFKKFVVFTPSYDTSKNEIERKESVKLKGAIKEAELITENFKNEHFKNEDATKKSFINNVSKARIIHLAMHANIDNEKPELSYFSFSKTAQEKEYKLYLEELYALKLNADIAVLSACNTGTGYLEYYNGAVSLQRAFTLAGVSSTVSSLWEVPDKATQEIMVSFYKNLKLGFSKPKALQQAKLAYMNSHADANMLVPYYWAGFVISGDMSPVTFEENPNNFLFYGVVILLFLVGIWLFKRFQKQ
jgi:CHAT domain-containing protein